MAGTAKLTEAVAYLRTSSTTNVGADKDSDKRQRVAIAAFAKRARFAVVDEFYDAAVSGADPIETPARLRSSTRVHRRQWRPHRDSRGRHPLRPRSRHLGASVFLILIKGGVRVLTAAGDDLTNTRRNCLTKLTPMPPGANTKMASGCAAAILESSAA